MGSTEPSVYALTTCNADKSVIIPIALGLTRFRRGLQSSAGHTEGFRFPRKSIWKKYSRKRRNLRFSRLIPAERCTEGLLGRARQLAAAS